MHLASLKVFCDVARHRSFSQAAHENAITQSAVSQIVAQLERHLNVRLIDRSSRPLRITPIGQTYYDGCKAILDRYQELEASVRSGNVVIDRKIEVAAIYSVGLGDMSQYVERFEAAEAGVHVHVEYLHPDRVAERVQEGAADLGLVSFPRSNSRLTALSWREEAMVLACSPRHPLAQNTTVRPRDLSGQRYIHFDRNLIVRREVDRFLREHGVSVDVVHEFDNVENIKEAVMVGAGVALLPEPTLRREIKARTIVALPLSTCRLVRPLGIIHRRRHQPSAAALKFIALLQAGIESANPQTAKAKAKPAPLSANRLQGRRGRRRTLRKAR
jgi:DNA-binding transcriptional LysR family regulator